MILEAPFSSHDRWCQCSSSPLYGKLLWKFDATHLNTLGEPADTIVYHTSHRVLFFRRLPWCFVKFPKCYIHQSQHPIALTGVLNLRFQAIGLFPNFCKYLWNIEISLHFKNQVSVAFAINYLLLWFVWCSRVVKNWFYLRTQLRLRWAINLLITIHEPSVFYRWKKVDLSDNLWTQPTHLPVFWFLFAWNKIQGRAVGNQMRKNNV